VNSEESFLLRFLNFDLWGYLSEKYKISPKKKFDIFFYSLLLIAFLLDFLVIHSNLTFFSYTLIFGITIMLNDKKFYEIKKIKVWEFILGAIVLIASFTIVTPIKWHFVPNTRVFGVFNGGIFIIGYFLLFYGLRKYRTVMPFLIFYGSLVTLNGTWGFVVNDFAQKHIAPVSSHLAYSFLNFLGYPVSISGTTITIISKNGEAISATVAGACSGIKGVTLFTLMIIGLLIGSQIKYRWRVLIILIGALIIFSLNILRISLIFIFGYYYGQRGLDIGHHWLGNILFLSFILSYWYIIDKKFVQRAGEQSGG